MLHSNTFNSLFNQARRFFVLAFLLFSVLLLIACEGEQVKQQENKSSSSRAALVIKVKDGDSLILRYANGVEKEVRLFGIDAPEYNQPFGRDAKRVLEKLVFKKSVQVIIHDIDRYKREVVTLIRLSDDLVINLEMIRLGAAWVYTLYQSDDSWLNVQNHTRNKKLGLWAFSRPVPPWEWRKK